MIQMKWRVILVSALLAVLLISCGQAPQPQAPDVRKEAKVDTIFGHVMTDNYYWLRDKENPEVIAYLDAENAYTDSVMEPVKNLREKLFEEMKGRIKEDDSSVPALHNGYYYYSRQEEGKQYPIYCRKKGSVTAPEEILLDVNQLAEGKDYMYVGSYTVSTDNRILAYTSDESGAERYTIKFKNLETGEMFPEEISNGATSMEWANDSRTLFYLTRDETWRTNKLYRHVLGTSPETDILVFEEPDERYWCGIGKTKDDKFLTLGIGSKITTEYRILEADNPTGKFRMFSPRVVGTEYEIAHHTGEFYIWTNADKAVNFKLMKAAEGKTDRKYWQEVIPASDSVMIDAMDIFANYLALFIRKHGQTMIEIRNLQNHETHFMEFEEPIYTVEPGTNLEYNTDILRFDYTSLLTPQSVFDYNMNERTKELKKEKEVLGGYDRTKYIQERIFATASDGSKIPISLCYPKNLKKDGQNFCYLYGYGAYGINYDPYFSTNRVSLLERGFIFAIAHVRGSGVMGRNWYEDGKFLNKKNSFTDFIASAGCLIEQGYTSSDRLAISGGSAGGLLVGAAMNMRPDLFEVVLAGVPFVDVINTMRDESIPLTVIEYDEWGNPHDSVYFEYMLSYSPYDNVAAMDYPNVLITAGLNDPRVQYWEPAKWTAKLRDLKTDNNHLLLYTNMGAGHGGASGRYEALKELALEYAFMFNVFGIKK